jgi:hypothetical protein
LLDVAPQAIVHLGDNLRADVQSAQRAGVNAFWYGRRVLDRRHGTTLGDRVLDRMAGLAAAKGTTSTEERVLRDVGHGVLAPIFLGLVQWLVEQVRSEPADLVLFCARDGYFLHQIYERFARRVVLPPAVYFEVSRRSLAFPSITTIDDRALDILCANFSPVVVAQYFSRIGLDINAYPAELEMTGLRADSLIQDRDSQRRLRTLFVALEGPVLERTRAERELTLAYLRECGVLAARRIVLVDIGWGGTLQQALAGLLAEAGEARSIRGYYLSTDDRILKLDAAAGPARGWFTNASEPAWMQEQMLPGYWLLEIAFAAQHGTVLGYYRDGENVRAEHHVYDAHAPNARAARDIQYFSSEVVNHWLRIFGGIGPSLPMLSAFARFQRFSQHPSHDEARFFGDIVHVGGLGATSEKQPVASPPALEVAVRKPRVLLNAYRESPWQVAFLQRVFRSNALACATLNVRSVFRRTRSNLKASLKHLSAANVARRG